MQYDENEGQLVFSTGKRVYCNGSIVGVGPNGQVFQGFDGDIGEELTLEERIELARHMQGLWATVEKAALMNEGLSVSECWWTVKE